MTAIFRYIMRDIMVNTIAAYAFIPRPIRFLIYRLYGMNIKTLKLRHGCYFESNHISVGRGTFINYGCVLANTDYIEIGDNCSLAYQVMLCTVSHEMNEPRKRAGKTVHSPIKIKNGCWLGARVTVLSGVTINEGCVVAAGSLVTEDCEPNSLYAGIPARKIRSLDA